MKLAKVPTPEPDEGFAESLERNRAELKRQDKRTRITPAELQAALKRIASGGEGFVIVGDDGEPLAQLLPFEPDAKNATRALQDVMDALRDDYCRDNPDGDFADHLEEARALFRQDG